MNQTPYENLANAIVLKAVDDYRKTDDIHKLQVIEKFFRSCWYQMLTNVDGEQLIEALREEKRYDC